MSALALTGLTVQVAVLVVSLVLLRRSSRNFRAAIAAHEDAERTLESAQALYDAAAAMLAEARTLVRP